MQSTRTVLLAPLGQVRDYGDKRIMLRLGMIVPFQPSKYSRTLQNILTAVAGTPGTKHAPVQENANDTNDAGSCATTGSGEGGADGGGDGDDDGGDGDSDGPRRHRPSKSIPRPRSRKSSPHSRTVKPPAKPPVDPSAPHRHALITLAYLSTILVLASLAFALAGHTHLAAKSLYALGGLGALATRLVKPK